MYRSPAFIIIIFYRGHPHFRDFNSLISVNVIRVKSHVDSFLDPTGSASGVVEYQYTRNKASNVPKNKPKIG